MTLKDISQMAGVATSTVSLVLNNKPGVRKDTRDRVAALLVQNGYTIRNKITNLPTRGEIKFVRFKATEHIRERNEDFYVKLLNGAEKKAHEKGYTLSIVSVTSPELHQLLTTLEQQSNLVGVLFLASELSYKDAALLCNFSLPLLSLDKQLDQFNINTLATSNIAGAYEAVQYLYRLGHRKIGLLRGQIDIGGICERAVGYRRAMQDLNLPYDEKYIVDIDLIFETATRQMEAYLASSSDIPTAFFAANDIIAAGCIRGLQRHGLRVPEDVSVIGFDDGSQSTFITPSLTTMRIPCDRMGALAVERLLCIAAGSADIIKCSLGVTLIERESTAPLL
ncbi:MAG: substrate-binding domain-containing protein [Eubacteriales bacterium]|nr:substrate-binding domain-containing protein [Eubacteriales bacterium]